MRPKRTGTQPATGEEQNQEMGAFLSPTQGLSGAQPIGAARLHRKHMMVFRECVNIYQGLWSAVYRRQGINESKKHRADLHLLFSHNRDSYKYPGQGQNRRSSPHCSQIKEYFLLPGPDECTRIKQMHKECISLI